MRVGHFAVVVAVAGILLSLVPRGAQAGFPPRRLPAVSQKAASVAQVRYIYHGLTVQPPGKRAGKGKVKQRLYNKYSLRTKAAQKASLHFPDGTALHINQRTNLTLRSPHVTLVTKGEVDQILAPGTNHHVQTASAVATAIGTQFDVQAHKKTFRVKETTGKKTKVKKVRKTVTTIIVIEGVVEVQNTKGPVGVVEVQAGQKTTVVQGKKPSTPVAVDTGSAVAWTKSIPAPPNPGMNIALQANGGNVVGYSSQSAGQGRLAARSQPRAAGDWTAANINDGNLQTGWSSASGQTKNQWVKIGFSNGAAYTITSVLIDPAATGGHPSSNDAKDFQIRLSTGGTGDSDFSTVLTGTLQQSAALQRFDLPQPTPARYLEYVAVDNYGGTDAVETAEVEAVTKSKPLSLPTVVPTATSTPAPAASPTPTSTPAANAYEFSVPARFYDLDPGDTPNVPTTEEEYDYTIEAYTCGPTPFSQPWHLQWNVQSNDDGRGLNETQTYTSTFTPGQQQDVPGSYFPTTLQIDNTASPQLDISVTPSWGQGSTQSETVPLVTAVCPSTPPFYTARSVNLQTRPISVYQAGLAALQRLEAGNVRSLSQLKAKRSRLLVREKALLRRLGHGKNVAARLGRVHVAVSKLDEDIAEYGRFAAQMRLVQRRAAHHLLPLLQKSMYGTWLKAQTRR